MLHTKECPMCGKIFRTQNPRKQCCGTVCAGKLSAEKRGMAPWEEASEAYLYLNAGRMSIASLIHGHRLKAARNGWHQRSEYAIKTKLTKMGISWRCTEDNLTMEELSRQLGISVDRVRGWVKRGLPAKHETRNKKAIKLKDLRDFLVKQPHRGGGIDRLTLSCLIGAEASEIVVSADHLTRGVHRAVVRLTDGTKYPTIREAARAVYVTPSTLSTALKKGTRAGGHQWRYADGSPVRK